MVSTYRSFCSLLGTQFVFYYQTRAARNLSEGAFPLRDRVRDERSPVSVNRMALTQILDC